MLFSKRPVSFKFFFKENGDLKYVSVLIEHESEPKPMLGGFLDHRKNVTYHHAATNTDIKEPAYREAGKNGKIIYSNRKTYE